MKQLAISFGVMMIMILIAFVLSEERVFVHPLTDMPGPMEDVETSAYFPNHPDQKFPIGETITVLCHLSNDGSASLNVTAIMGSLNFVFDFRHHIQNYTYKPFGFVVKPGEEVTLQYQFHIHPDLEPVEYTLAHTVFYESERESYSNTFFNQTVELYSPISDYDLTLVGQLLFSFLCTIFVFSLTFYTIFPEKSNEILYGKAAASAMNAKKSNPVESSSWDDDEDIIKTTNTKRNKRKQ